VPARRSPRKWVAHGLSNTVVYGGLLHGAVRLPLPVLRGISLVGNSIAVALMRRTMRDVARNFQDALGVGPAEARRMARRTFYDYGRTTVDLWRCRSGIAELVPRMTTFDADGATLKSLCRGGRGFLLVTGHVGNWEMGAVALRGHEISASVLGQPEIDPRVHAMRIQIRERLGVDSIDIGSQVATALQVRSAVVRGAVVAMAADRAYQDDQVFVPFFGRQTAFLRSPAMLARFCSCPLVPAFFLRNSDGSYRGVLGDPLEARHEVPSDVDAVRMMGAVALALERTVREAPTQWFNFFRYWASDEKDPR
jgi:lauroyl/myristoyl acyltransferase